MKSLALTVVLIALGLFAGFSTLMGLLAYTMGLSGWTLVGVTLLSGGVCTLFALRAATTLTRNVNTWIDLL